MQYLRPFRLSFGRWPPQVYDRLVEVGSTAHTSRRCPGLPQSGPRHESAWVCWSADADGESSQTRCGPECARRGGKCYCANSDQGFQRRSPVNVICPEPSRPPPNGFSQARRRLSATDQPYPSRRFSTDQRAREGHALPRPLGSIRCRRTDDQPGLPGRYTHHLAGWAR